jgi:hypothetical protein
MRINRSETPVALHKHLRPPDEQTPFVAYIDSVPLVIRQPTGTVTIAELQRQGFAGLTFNSPDESQDELSSASEARLNLLARKYEGTWNSENEARFQILTQRLRRLDPRVTSKELDSMKTVVGQLEDVSSMLSDIQQKFRIR